MHIYTHTSSHTHTHKHTRAHTHTKIHANTRANIYTPQVVPTCERHCNALNTLQHTATHCNTLQHAATTYFFSSCSHLHIPGITCPQTAFQCNTLHYTATQCNTLQQHLTHAQHRWHLRASDITARSNLPRLLRTLRWLRCV